MREKETPSPRRRSSRTPLPSLSLPPKSKPRTPQREKKLLFFSFIFLTALLFRTHTTPPASERESERKKEKTREKPQEKKKAACPACPPQNIRKSKSEKRTESRRKVKDFPKAGGKKIKQNWFRGGVRCGKKKVPRRREGRRTRPPKKRKKHSPPPYTPHTQPAHFPSPPRTAGRGGVREPRTVPHTLSNRFHAEGAWLNWKLSPAGLPSTA